MSLIKKTKKNERKKQEKTVICIVARLSMCVISIELPCFCKLLK